MSRKRPREIAIAAPVTASAAAVVGGRTEESIAIEIPTGGHSQNGGGGDGANGNGSSNGATQKRFSSIRIDDDGMEMGSSDNFWPPNPGSLHNGHVDYGE